MGLLAFMAVTAAVYLGYTKARAFVRNKMRYVDSVHQPAAPWKAGFLAALIALPIAWVLPVVSGASALFFGTAVGMGVAAGRRDIRKGVAL